MSNKFQCPLGLIPHFYKCDASLNFTIDDDVSMPSRAYTSFLHDKYGMQVKGKHLFQCPLGLIPHFYGTPSKT